MRIARETMRERGGGGWQRGEREKERESEREREKKRHRERGLIARQKNDCRVEIHTVQCKISGF